MSGDKLTAAFLELEIDVELIPRTSAGELFRLWCSIYCQPVRMQTGKNRHLGFHWHAFSYDFSPSREGVSAFELYAAERPTSLVIIPEFWSVAPCVRCYPESPPDLTELRLDLYVFPESAEWTMAFTHEQPGIGPYFSRREWVET